jgi:hypothetical protein
MLTSDEVRDQLISVLGFFWIKVFLDEEFLNGHVNTVTVQMQDLLNQTDDLQNYLSRLTLPITESHSTRLFAFNENNIDRVAARYGDAGRVYGAGDLMHGQLDSDLETFKYPIDEDYIPQYLATTFNGEQAILKIGEDYTIEDGMISFNEDPLRLAGLQKRLFNNLETEPIYQFLLWGFSVEEDLQAICNYFGVIAGICGESTPSWKEAMNIAWDLRVEGASVCNVHRLLSIVTGTDFTEEGGTVIAIYNEGNRICVQTETSVYTAPSQCSSIVEVGEEIQRGQIIFDTFSIVPGTSSLPFEHFEGLTLGTGYLHRLSSSGIFLPNALTATTTTKADNWLRLVKQ